MTTMTKEQIIDVIKAYQNGETIQCNAVKNQGREGGWQDEFHLNEHGWKFDTLDYRVKLKPLERWVNVYKDFTYSFASQDDANKFATPNRIRLAHLKEVV